MACTLNFARLFFQDCTTESYALAAGKRIPFFAAGAVNPSLEGVLQT